MSNDLQVYLLPPYVASELEADRKVIGKVVQIDGHWKLEGFQGVDKRPGFISFFMQTWELLRSLDPNLPVILPRKCIEPETIERLFGGSIGKPGRRATTRDLADFARQRRPLISWKEISQEWNTINPDRPASDERTREAFRRFYRGKGN